MCPNKKKKTNCETYTFKEFSLGQFPKQVIHLPTLSNYEQNPLNCVI